MALIVYIRLVDDDIENNDFILTQRSSREQYTYLLFDVLKKS